MAIEGVGEVFAKLQGVDSTSWNVFRVDKRQEVWTTRPCPRRFLKPPVVRTDVSLWGAIRGLVAGGDGVRPHQRARRRTAVSH